MALKGQWLHFFDQFKSTRADVPTLHILKKKYANI